jgi:hypothetical protein
VTQLWIPGAAGPQDEFVARVNRQVGRFAQERGLAQAIVEVELRDGARFTLGSLTSEPGYGFVTLQLHPGDDADDVPEELIVPIGAVDRIELRASDDPEPPFGFSAEPVDPT